MKGLEIGLLPAAAAFSLLLAIALVPLASVDLPPLFDYPNHLARMAILADGGRNAWLHEYYLVRWSPLPNLAMDAIVPLLGRWMPLADAGRLFIAATYMLIAGGVMLLYRAGWGRWSWWSCLGFFLLYNRPLLWGFLNYLFGVGLALCVTALWLALPSSPKLRTSLVVPLALATFFCHIAAFGVLGLLVAGCEIVPAWQEFRAGSWRALTLRAVYFAACFAVPIVIFTVWLPHVPGSLSYGHYWRKADLLFSVFDDYHRGFDVFCFILFLALLVAGGIKGRIHPRLGGAACVIGLSYFAVPDTLFTGAGADHRLPVAIFAAIIPAIKTDAIAPRSTLGLLAAFIAMFVIRIATIEPVWLAADAGYRRDLQALSLLPAGTRLAVASPESAVRVSGFPEVHFPTMAIATRQAFVPALFTFATQQPVAFRPPYQAMATLGQSELLWKALIERNARAKDAASSILARYDAVAMVDDGVFTAPGDPCLTPIGGTPSFRLFRVMHDADRCP